jgi:hypothetical protein
MIDSLEGHFIFFHIYIYIWLKLKRTGGPSSQYQRRAGGFD